MDELFTAVRQACSANMWSRGVELTRRFAVSGVSASDEEVICRVKLPDRMLPVTVQLYPEDEEWDCDCQSRTPCCEHVAAAVIAVRKAHAEGLELPRGSSAEAKLVYRLSRHGQELSLKRVLIKSDGSETLLSGSLASAVARKTTGVDLAPSQGDLNVDRLLGTQGNGPLHRERVGQIIKLLGAARNVEFERRSVYIATEALKPHAHISDAEGGGFLVELEKNPRITEVIASGVALCEDTIHLLCETAATGLHLERLPDRKVYDPSQTSTLVTEVLPELQRRFDVTVDTTRLPELTDEFEPRVIVEVEQQGGTLSALATLVYGSPPVARVDGHRLLHLQGPVPIRDLRAEARATSRAKSELGLVVGHRQILERDQATALAAKLDRWGGEIQGSQGSSFIRQAQVRPVLDGDAEGLGLSFQATDATGNTVHASPDEVLRAWELQQPLVPLLEGGWAALPEQWLESNAAKLVSLLAGRDPKQPQGQLAPHALPALAALYADLDTPPPPRLKPLCDLLRGLDHLPKASLPEDLTATLRDYQRQGVNWLCLMKRLRMGVTLADDMGLGKTLQALCVIQGRTLVVCPTSVVHNWAAEIRKFRPGLSFSIYHGKGRTLDTDAAVTLTSYALLRLDQEVLGPVSWDTVILDEAQTIKNPESQVTQAAYLLRAEFRVTLSGTPVENRLEELWSQFHFTNPGLLGGRTDFQERYAQPIQEGQAGAAEALRQRIGPFLLRRDKRTVAPELPARTDLIEHIELNPQERELYNTLLAATQKEVVERLRAGGSVMQALEALLRLRQAACHPALLPGQTAENSSKVEHLLSTLESGQADGHRSLVFSQWTSFLDLVQQQLQASGLRYTRLDGSTRDREGVVRQFQSPDGPEVMLLSLKAGGTGLNLTAADHVFLMDLWWNPAVEQQATDRAHRIGQDRPVFVHRLVAVDTVEERILKLQEKKRALADAALSDAAKAGSLTREDLLALLE
jgi:hypothetical protein